MTRLAVLLGLVVLAVAVTPIHAQQSSTPGTGSPQTQAPPAPGTGTIPEACRQMMMSGQMGGHHMMGGGPGMMGGGMMGPGMMGGYATDPRTTAELLEMRGEMMKAMGDIMIKHAKRIRAQAPASKSTPAK